MVQSVPGGQQGKDAAGWRGWADPATGEALGMRSLPVVSPLFWEGHGLRTLAHGLLPRVPPAFPQRPAAL